MIFHLQLLPLQRSKRRNLLARLDVAWHQARLMRQRRARGASGAERAKRRGAADLRDGTPGITAPPGFMPGQSLVRGVTLVSVVVQGRPKLRFGAKSTILSGLTINLRSKATARRLFMVKGSNGQVSAWSYEQLLLRQSNPQSHI